MATETYISLALREFTRMKKLADRAVAQVGDQQFVADLHRWDNSIAIVVKHMAGNMRSRWRDFLTSDGEKPDRNRDTEFELDDTDTKQSLLERWEAGWRLLFDALEPLGDDDLERVVIIRGEELTVLQAINRQLTHYAYHVGQVVFLARHFAGDDWQSLSVPKGKSSAFNAETARYVDDAGKRLKSGLRVKAGTDRFGLRRKVFGSLPIDVKVAAGDTDGGVLLIEQVDDRKGGPPRHVHHRQEEWFYVVEGYYVIEVGDERFELRSGDSILAPRAVPHVWAHMGEGTGRLLIGFQPAGQMEDFFARATRLDGIPEGPELARLFRDHGMELLGPPLPTG